MHLPNTGILLLNLGTPTQPDIYNVRKYLREFLNDKRVVNLPWLFRKILVNGLIVPFRAAKTTAAYSSIWQEGGSPLLVNSRNLQAKLQQELGGEYLVELGMTYGSPSISQALYNLQQSQVTKIVLVPLFPQYSSAASGAPLEQAIKYFAQSVVVPEFKVINQFYAYPDYINSLADSIKPHIKSDDFLLLSYHGLPEQQIIHYKEQCANQHCNMLDACPKIQAFNRDCYRAQCYETSRLLAQKLQLRTQQWTVGFQSRLGRLPWIKPYTDETLPALYERGISNLAVCCPSFVVDCLETLEEVGMRAREQWLSLGGKKFTLIPCLNDGHEWILALSSLVR